MARVLGEAARYVTRQSVKKYQREFVVINLASYFLAFIIGLWLGLSLTKHAYLWMWITIFILALILFLTIQFTNSVTDKLERKRISYRKGATGEAVVGYILGWLPEDYVVIHGLKPKPNYGDVDHIVIGPTGVYAIDTKNWKGVITADDKGELLLNGKPQKPAAKNLFRTIMSIKGNIKFLSGLDPYIRGILAFPAARVEARWGSTGPVHCVSDEQLYDYIVETKKRKKLARQDIESISQAFLALARMDKDFASDSR
jgi:Ca2+/Na+ antiporter